MKTFLIIILSIGILLQFYFGDKEITKWRELATENYIDKVYLAVERDSLRQLVKSFHGEFETIQDAYEFRSKYCDSVLTVRDVRL